MASLNYGINLKKIAIIACIVLVAIGALLGGFFGVRAIVKNNQAGKKNYYTVTFYFLDDFDEPVVDVVAKCKEVEIGKSDQKGKMALENVEENSLLSFWVKGYDFETGKKDYLVTKDVKFMFVTVIRNKEYVNPIKPANVTFKVTDQNKLPLSNVTIYLNEKKKGVTNAAGILETRVDLSTFTLSLKHKYYQFVTKNIEIDVEQSNVVSTQGSFSKEAYFKDAGEELLDGTLQATPNTFLSTYYTFYSPTGKQFSTYYTVVMDSEGKQFSTKNIYSSYDSFCFENMKSDQLFHSIYCYLYDEESSSWYCSDILTPSTCSGKIVLHQATCVSIHYSQNYPVFTSDGKYFASNEAGVVNLVLDSFSNLSYYANYLDGNLFNELMIVDENSLPVEDILKADSSNLFFKLKSV